MPAPRPASAGRPAAARPASPGRRRLGEPKFGNEAEFVPPSPSTLPIFHFKADLMRHQERIETIISEMLVRIPEVTSQAVRDELGSLKIPMNRQRSSVRMSQRSSLQFTGSVADLPSVPQVSLNQPFGEDESLNNQLAFSRSTSSNGKSPSRRPSQQDKLEAWGGIEEEAKFKLDRDKVKGVKDFLEMKKRQLDAATGKRCQRFARMLVTHPKFELGCAMLILVCAVMIGVEAHWTVEHIGSPEPLTFRILNSIFNLLFAVELILRATVDGLYFWSCSNPSIHWNLMDSVLVASGLLEELLLVLLYAASVNLSGLKILRMVRLARILRIVKVVRFFSELRIMVNGVIGSAKSLIWALLLLILVNFLFGVLVMQLSVEYLENVDSRAELLDYFGSLDRTMLTLYESVSGGIDWNNAVVTLRPVGVWMEYIFGAYVFFTVFCCMNIVTGIFVDNAKALKVADEEAMHHEAMKERQKWIVEVADLFSRISEAHEGRLTKQQFVYHVTNSDRIATCFSHLGINTETTNTDELWDLFDMDENGCIDQEEFAMGIKQFHGAARSIDLFKMRREVKELVRLVKEVSFQIS